MVYDMSMNDFAQLDELMTTIMHQYSVSDSETELADWVEKYLDARPWLEVHRMGDTVVASTHFGKSQRVILAGHIDVVPVIDNFPPQLLEPGNGKIRKEIREAYPQSSVIWGRGATDMKGSDATFLYLADILNGADKIACDITYIFYDHEEVEASKNGLGKVVNAHPEWISGDFAVIGEPSNGLIEGGCNGTMRFDIITHGIAAHSARAWMGDNAIHHAARVLRTLDEYEPDTITVDGLEYREGLNATMISGGEGTNIIPQECRIHVNYRFAPDKSIAEAKALLMGQSCASRSGVGKGVFRADGGLFEGYDIEMKDESAGARPGLDNPVASHLVQLVYKRTEKMPTAKFGWTDVARLSTLGIPAVNLGAGDPLLAHKSDEQIAVQALHEYAQLLLVWLADTRVVNS
ncbi:succinyl-diaminopimelate desuccinylase [Alloscardovia venturai]|uniref:Succinyl-diaminopimelate desuccinylase n=1 Tax=Alloscardovia venturai TaxID=1769421 RepID=A0ABW2Y780_9BIFI